MTQTAQQQRAAHALKEVRRLLELKEVRSKLKPHAQAFPALVHMNGLGQAAAFYAAGSEKAQRELYHVFSDWLCGANRPFAGSADLLDAITQSDLEAYMLAQAEALELAQWVKRFAEAFAPDATREPRDE